MTPAAILFDLDGTLLDTIDDLADSANSMLAHFGAPPHSPDDYKLMIGDGLEELVRRALPESMRDPQTLTEAIRLGRDAYAQRWQSKTRPYPGIPELLRTIASHHIPMAVLSNKPDDFTKTVVRELLAEFAFEQVVGARPGVPRKPDPAGAFAVTSALGVDPTGCWFLGDSDVDMLTAVSAGMRPVGVLWGFRDEAELRDNGAELVLSHPSELVRLL